MVYIKEELFINKKLKELKIAKKIIEDKNNDGLDLFTHNNITGTDGIGCFCPDNKTIAVFEGESDGSDDKIMDYKTFIKNYSFYVADYDEQIKLTIRI